MIYVLKGTTFKPSKHSTIEKLIEVFNVVDFTDTNAINRQLEKGNHVYCWFTSDSEDNKVNMYWGSDPEKELENYYTYCDEI